MNDPIPSKAGREPVNVLLVDDNPAKLLSYEAILGELGENLIAAASGTEALEQLLKHEIAVVLLDVCMPDIDGFELAAMLRQHPRCQHTAIIFISAVHLSDTDRQRGFESGAVDYVPVPVVPEILRARVSVFAELYRKTRQLERMNRGLEDAVSARTAELAASAERLRISEERLREQDRRKDEFLAMLAHELRNPLNPIRNAVELLRTGPDPVNLRWARDVIDRQVNHLARLVDDLLDVNRITRSRLALQRGRVDLGAVIAAAVEGSRPQFESRGHHLRIEMSGEPIELDADFVRLSQVFLNLLDNAAKYTPPGGRVGLRVDRESDVCVIRVMDSGHGIEPEDLPQVFDLFYQSGSSRGTAGGLGIGLTLVQRLVELHGGRVEARSGGRDKGSEFLVRLPLPVPRTLPDEAPAAPLPKGRARRVLVVDDNDDSAQSLARLLEIDGHTVATAGDGEHALEEAERFRPDAVLLDLGLPKLDGYEVCRRLRSGDWSKDLQIVAVTGWGQANDRRRTREAGFDAHLTKPIDRGVLHSLLAREKQSAVAATSPAEPAGDPA